jgi:3-oxoacyl-(acyl-carrier-protein) synthase
MHLGITRDLLSKTPIEVTGMGVYGAAGSTVSEFWTNILSGVSMATNEVFNGVDFIVCRAPDPDSEASHFPLLRKMGRVSKMAASAARQAWTDSGLDRQDYEASRCGVIVGTSRGSLFEHYSKERTLLPSTSANSSGAAISGMLSRMLGIEGPSFTINATCSSGAHAIVMAAQQILTGVADIMLVGGAEAPLYGDLMVEMDATGILAKNLPPVSACRPFSANRHGTVLGEGASFLVLESADSASRRGRSPFARLAGWNLATDSLQRTGISSDLRVMIRALQGAVLMAGLDVRDIGYVHAHGTGTRMNDQREAQIIQKLFPEGIPCSSTKPVTGHCLGAAGSLGAVVSIQALREGILPPSANCLPMDPNIDLQLIQKEPLKRQISSAMSNAAGFWGNTSSLIFSV